MRTLEELYTVVSTHYNTQEGSDFICIRMYDMARAKCFTVDEFKLVYGNFTKNRPTPLLHIAFHNHELYSRTCWNWFGNGEEARHVRTNFLKYLIRNHIV